MSGLESSTKELSRTRIQGIKLRLNDGRSCSTSHAHVTISELKSCAEGLKFFKVGGEVRQRRICRRNSVIIDAVRIATLVLRTNNSLWNISSVHFARRKWPHLYHFEHADSTLKNTLYVTDPENIIELLYVLPICYDLVSSRWIQYRRNTIVCGNEAKLRPRWIMPKKSLLLSKKPGTGSLPNLHQPLSPSRSCIILSRPHLSRSMPASRKCMEGKTNIPRF